jgi:hypothetical protein
MLRLNGLWTRSVGMTLTRTFITTAIAGLVIATGITTTIAFPNVAVFATPLTATEQTGTATDTTGATTTSTSGVQQHTIHIIKDGTNSYVISGGSSSIGSFDTTYRVAGERSAMRSAENLIITTITDDFRKSPTIGDIQTGSMSTTGAGATLPNPFATPEQITERITNELRRVITEAENNTSQGQYVEIKCEFGMTLEDMQCHYLPLPQAGQGQ